MTTISLTSSRLALFMAKVDRRGPDDCWPWLASLHHGYGQFNTGNRAGARMTGAHRISYEIHVGPVPAGLQLDHLCHTRDTSCAGGVACLHRRCVNPAHLEPVTHRVNARRGQSRAGKASRRDHCLHGHPYTAENTRTEKRTGSRTCRTCKREREARRIRDAAALRPPRNACDRGHVYNSENTYYTKDGKRQCRRCQSLRRCARITAQTGRPSFPRSKSHCRRGHTFDEVNTRIAASGQRLCRACLRLASERRKSRKQGANLS
jgi:hypothetical protein